MTIDVLTHDHLEALMASVCLVIDYDQSQDHPAPEIDHRDDMPATAALWDCCNCWASGVWDERNTNGHLQEVQHHLSRIVEEVR